MIRVKDVENRHNYTYIFGGVKFRYFDIFDEFIVVKLDPETLRIWL